MATMQMRFTLSTGADITYTVNLSDAHANRIINAHRTIYILPGGSTAQQVWDRIGAGEFNLLKAQTIAQETAAAQPVISNITFT